VITVFYKNFQPLQRGNSKMHLSYDELALVFSFLEPVEQIPTLNLVCKQWYEVSSIKNGVDTFLWKQWYCSAIDFYIARTPKPYRRKWLIKKKNKTDHRNYRELLNGIIISSEYIRKTKIKTKIERMFHAPYVQILSLNLDQILVLLRANEKLFAKLGPTAVGQGFFQKLLGATKNTRDSFSKLCTLLDVMNISTDTKFIEKNWKDISGRISEHSYSLLLPTQQMILYGLFEEAKILHEMYGFPLSFHINDTVTITSTNVLLCRDVLRFQNSSARPSYYNNFTTPPEAHVQMLEWLIEKEGMPSQCLDLTQYTQVIVHQALYTTPSWKCFYRTVQMLIVVSERFVSIASEMCNLFQINGCI
jgi:hypothetical protein